MFTTLYGKLAAVLLGLLCLIGGLYIFLTMMTTRLYDQEVTQKLNRALAQNLVAENMRFCREFYLCTNSGMLFLCNLDWTREGAHG